MSDDCFAPAQDPGDPDFCFYTLVRWLPEHGNSSRVVPQRGFISRSISLRGEVLALFRYTEHNLMLFEAGLEDGRLEGDEVINLSGLTEEKDFMSALYIPWCNVQYVTRLRMKPNWDVLERSQFLGASHA